MRPYIHIRTYTRFGEGEGQLDRGRARGVLNPCARESKARTGRFLRENVTSDYDHFSSYEGHKERRTGKIRRTFSKMPRSLDGWMLARASASPAAGLHHHRPRYYNFPFFCTMCAALRNLDLLIKTDWSVFCPLCC